MNSNCPRPLRAIKHIAHALIYVLNSPFSTWYIECMPQSHGHHQARYNLCHIPTPRKSSGSWTLVFQIPSACKYCSKTLRNPPARWFIVIFISQKFYLWIQETKKKYFANALSKVARYSNDVYYRKMFWFRCCLRTKYDGIFWEVLISRRFLQNPTDPPPFKRRKNAIRGGYL